MHALLPRWAGERLAMERVTVEGRDAVCCGLREWSGWLPERVSIHQPVAGVTVRVFMYGRTYQTRDGGGESIAFMLFASRSFRSLPA